MRRGLSIIAIVFLVLSGFGLAINFDIGPENVSAVTIVFGTYTEDTTWNHPVFITGDVNIRNNAKVTIPAGTTVQFNGTTYSITVESGSSLDAIGASGQPIIFNTSSGRWDTIAIQSSAYANFTHCEFESSNNGISLSNNNFQTYIANCSFNDTGSYYFSLTNSKLNVISTKFEGKAFENQSTFSANMNKIDISDESSELFIEYIVEVEAENGYVVKLKDINTRVQMQSGTGKTGETYLGKTDTSGTFKIGRVTAFRINTTSPNHVANFSYTSQIDVWDNWDGTSKSEPGISRQVYSINNASDDKDETSLKIELKFIFDYPPRIDTQFSTKVNVKEEKQEKVTFNFHDNDDFKTGIKMAPNKFDNITIFIKDQNGVDIYDDDGSTSGKANWIKWENKTVSGGPDPKLVLYRTVESPFTVAGQDDYKQKVTENINITIKDDLGHENWTGPVEVEFQNVPDKPDISIESTVSVTEDIDKFIPITISDDDNATGDIVITSDVPYVTYQKSGTTLKINFPNEFGGEGAQQLVNITATDNCVFVVDSTPVKNEVTQSFNIIFHQTPDAPEIKGTIPDMVGNETDWVSALDLKEYWSDPDPDEESSTLEWYVTGEDKSIFEVSGENVTANTPLVFNLAPNIELGGARIPKQIEDDIKIWLVDKDGLRDSQAMKLKLSSTNLQPSLHKVEKSGKKISVDPESGDSELYFKFMIEYKDLDGDKGDNPEFVRVVIDDNSYDMIETNPTDDNYKDGKKYHYEIKLTPGTHTHYFVCSDSELEARHPDAPQIINLPIVESRVYIEEFKSLDSNIIARIAYGGSEGDASIDSLPGPSITHEENKGDMDEYFKVTTKDMSSIIWIDFTIQFGKDFKNYQSKWLRKDDMQLAYVNGSKWMPIITSTVNKNNYLLRCNVTPEPTYGYDVLFKNILDLSNTPAFTVIGWLDADGDGYFNDEDAFPFDLSARYDRDSDGSPGDTEWVPGKSAKDSTSKPPLHEDKFPEDPAASLDDDNDGCPDEWNPGQSEENSTTGLKLDKFPDNQEACEDTDNDNQPDGDPFNSRPWMDTDDDNDGMLDYWENEMNDKAIEKGYDKRFDPKDPSDGAADWDGDGRNNTQEYKDGSNPFEKDSEDDGVLPVGMELFIILIVVIIIIILIVVFILRKRKSAEKEDLPRGMGAPPPEEPQPPASPDEGAVEPGYDMDMAPAYEGEAEQPNGAYDEPEMEAELEGEPAVEGEELEMEPEPGVTEETSEEPEAEIEVEDTEGESDEGLEESVEQEQVEDDQASAEEATEIQYTCPNCNTPVTSDMAACPGCQTPLTFE